MQTVAKAEPSVGRQPAPFGAAAGEADLLTLSSLVVHLELFF